MKNCFLVGATIAIAILSGAAHGENRRDEGLRKELLEMQRIDQEARRARDSVAMRSADGGNTKRLKEIVAKQGWPTISSVGEDGALAAWLLAQHADADPSFQIEVLRLMEPLVGKNEASGKQFAYLYDRTHKPQRYGTQGACTGPRTWTAREIDDPAMVDVRRVAVGLEPGRLADYAKMVGERLCK